MSIRDPNFGAGHPCYIYHDSVDLGRLELSCLYGLEKFYFDYEKKYDPWASYQFMRDRPWLPILVCSIYVVAIFSGQEYFKTRERWNWRFALGVWNLGLSVFSIMGVLRLTPQMVHNLVHYSIRDNFCFDVRQLYGAGASGLWCQLFVWSKFAELFDTFFIVIHKKPLILLHWYHHITVLLNCWFSYVAMSTPGIFFTLMNYSVHSIMYFYYFLMAARMKPKWFNPMVLTIMQLAQMVIGMVLMAVAYYYYKTDKDDCFITEETITAGFVTYASYFLLFFQFFMRRYFGGEQQKKQKIW